MKLIRRLFILVITALLGTWIYNNYNDITTTKPAETTEKSTDKPAFSPRFQGGIGPVGNPHSTTPFGQPAQRPFHKTIASPPP